MEAFLASSCPSSFVRHSSMRPLSPQRIKLQKFPWSYYAKIMRYGEKSFIHPFVHIFLCPISLGSFRSEYISISHSPSQNSAASKMKMCTNDPTKTRTSVNEGKKLKAMREELVYDDGKERRRRKKKKGK